MHRRLRTSGSVSAPSQATRGISPRFTTRRKASARRSVPSACTAGAPPRAACTAPARAGPCIRSSWSTTFATATVFPRRARTMAQGDRRPAHLVSCSVPKGLSPRFGEVSRPRHQSDRTGFNVSRCLSEHRRSVGQAIRRGRRPAPSAALVSETRIGARSSLRIRPLVLNGPHR